MSITVNGTSGLTFNDASTQNTAATGFGFKNRIINGDMRIDQRNAGTSVSTAGGSIFTVDRWNIQTNTAGSIQQIASTFNANLPYSIKYISAGAAPFLQLGQQIEYLNMADLAGQVVTISFYIKANNTNSGSTSFVVRTRESATQDALIRFSGPNTDTSLTISTTATKYSVQRTIGATTKAFSLEFSLGAHVSGDGFEITGVQLEKGSTTTSYDLRPYGTELALCQRYFEAGIIPSGFNVTANAVSLNLAFKQVMRATPAIAFTSALTITDGVANFTQSSASPGGFLGTNTGGLLSGAPNFTGLTALRPVMVNVSGFNNPITASAEL